MGLLDSARQALSGLPINDILRERLSLTIDYTGDLERKVSDLQTQVGSLQSQLDRVTLERDQIHEQYDSLKQLHEEEVRIVRTIEFRRGTRTGGMWCPFCPKCHLPITPVASSSWVHCSAMCGLQSNVSEKELIELTAQIESQERNRTMRST